MRKIRQVLASVLGAFVLFLGRPALAETATGRMPDAHPHYAFEAEPHGLIGLWAPKAYGVGFRGTFLLSDSGFIRNVNDTVGLGVGIDWTHDTTWVPIVLQWNFWVSQHWSVFAEPGVGLRWRDQFETFGPDPTLYGGARWQFAPGVTLTMRVGYPAFALGFSFLL